MRNDILEQARAIKAKHENKEVQLDSIKTMIADLGTVPSLFKLREFLTALKELLEDKVTTE